MRLDGRTMLLLAVSAIAGLLTSAPADAEPATFKIEIVRQRTANGLVYGTIGVNDSGIGGAFENADLKIPAGTYRGLLRYWSKKGFAQGPFGSLGREGDFLLEVADVRDGERARTNILFHAGNKPHHSAGC